jgi:hypothetical protein
MVAAMILLTLVGVVALILVSILTAISEEILPKLIRVFHSHIWRFKIRLIQWRLRRKMKRESK